MCTIVPSPSREAPMPRPLYLPPPDDPEPEGPDAPAGRVCTPERLLAFMNRLGRQPTLLECKNEFGGILAVLTSGWALQQRGLWPKFPERNRPR